MTSEIFRTRNYFYDPCLYFLFGEGYSLGRKIGEGKSREVYEATYERERGVRKKRVVKVPKDGMQSVQGRINFSREDRNKREAKVLNSLDHSAIVKIHDVLFHEGRTITAEEYVDAFSLEQHVELRGPILNQEHIMEVFSPVIDALQYIHAERQLLHRDVKPSNILMSKHTGIVKLTDFQNASNLEDVTERFLPTRGGTQFADPLLLEDFMAGKKSCTTVTMELYSLAASMYYALTGDVLLDFALVEDDEGQEISIDRKIKVAITQNGKKLHRIDRQECHSIIVQKLKKVPLPFRDLLLYCLSLEKRKYVGSPEEIHQRFREDFHGFMRNKLIPVGGNIVTKVRGTEEPLKNYIIENQVDELTTPLSLDDLDGVDHTTVSSIIEETIPYVLAHGVREWGKSNFFDSKTGGSDSYITKLSTQVYTLKKDSVQVGVTDINRSMRYGQRSPGWSETYKRQLEIAVGGKKIFAAEKLLGGETGSLSRNDYRSPGAWRVTTIGSIDEVVGSLDFVRGLEEDKTDLREI